MYQGPTIPIDLDFDAAFTHNGERSPPLMINIRVIDNKTDQEEKLFQINLRRLDKALSKAEYDRQKVALEAKVQTIMKLLIWAMNNGKTLEIMNCLEDMN